MARRADWDIPAGDSDPHDWIAESWGHPHRTTGSDLSATQVRLPKDSYTFSPAWHAPIRVSSRAPRLQTPRHRPTRGPEVKHFVQIAFLRNLHDLVDHPRHHCVHVMLPHPRWPSRRPPQMRPAAEGAAVGVDASVEHPPPP